MNNSNDFQKAVSARHYLGRINPVLVIWFCLLFATISAAQTDFTRRQYEEDFDYLWQSIADDYAYLDQKQTDWKKVKDIYRPGLNAVRTRGEFVGLLESMLEELYDSHTHLNTNTPSSPRLVPSGADIWAEWINGRILITEVRPESRADRAGIRIGMQLVSINGVAVDEAVNRRVGKSLRTIDKVAREWALRTLLAGRRNEKRSIEVISKGKRLLVPIDDQPSAESPATTNLLESRRIEKHFGYIRINNSLGDNELIRQFDLALAAFRNTRGLVLDLRDTPSGGNTTVARGIMGRFIHRDMPYQKHSIPAEERRYATRRSWIELVSPRGEFTYRAPIVVLVNHWTGSMGEGIAIGMDGMRRATIVGTEMARLLGATSGIRLPNTGIGATFPTEKLFHVNGTPRENFVPPVSINLLLPGNQDGDAILNQGLKVLKTKR
ncbi:MAG TPA: S41 family peptidase [Pyrinomonadaceae bacterium]|nr:S41 family peptidase [Pyrinomonadaceae bacterium]